MDKGLKKRTSTIVSPEEKLRKSRLAKLRFRSAIRFVIANLYWMSDPGEDTLGDDVRKNIALLLKRKKQQKEILTLCEKYILSKKPDDRSDIEKMHLYRVIGNLKCFRKYPEYVKIELAAVTNFVYYGPGRVIVKQFRKGHSLYFIISGEVAVSITSFDPVLNEMKTEIVGTMVQGQMFGEISLLHNIPRTATITTLTHCELLLLRKEDFDIILKGTLQQHWDQILNSVKKFQYFDSWNDVDKRECCIYSKIRSYKKDDVVFNSDIQNPYVYFITKGQCKIIEELPIVTGYKNGYKSYYLFNKEKYLKFMKDNEENEEEPEMLYITKAKRKSSIRVSSNPEENELKSYSVTHQTISSLLKKSSTNISLIGKNESSKLLSKSVIAPRSQFLDEADSKSLQNVKVSRIRFSKTKQSNVDMNKELHNFEENTETANQGVKYPDYVQKIFMQVCIMNELACFNIGENQKDRTIVAATDVECLLIPRYWLLQRNKGNVWMIVQQFLNNNIPTTAEVFYIFVENRKWNEYKRGLVNHIRGKPLCNNVCNIPYSIKLVEDIPYDTYYM